MKGEFEKKPGITMGDCRALFIILATLLPKRGRHVGYQGIITGGAFIKGTLSHDERILINVYFLSRYFCKTYFWKSFIKLIEIQMSGSC
jgi:hypothetical protein